MRRKEKQSGFHIAFSTVNPGTKYLGENGEYVSIRESLFFLDHKHARDYAKENRIEIKDAHNVIVPCKCDESTRERHKIASGYR
jgi:hypothetical protein